MKLKVGEQEKLFKSHGQVRNMLTRALKETNPHVQSHDFRKSRINHLLREKDPELKFAVHEVMRYVGHKRI